MNGRSIRRLLASTALVTGTFPLAAQQQRAARDVQEPSGVMDTALLMRQVSVDLKDVPLRRAVVAVAKAAGVHLLYKTEVLDAVRTPVTLHASGMSLGTAFRYLLTGTELRAVPVQKDMISIEPVEGRTIVQDEGRVIGRVVDSATQKAISGATVTVVGTSLSAVTGENGVFRIDDVPVGTQTVSAKLLGYRAKTVRITIKAGQSAAVTIALPQMSTTLSEVVTTATGQQRRVEVANDIAKIDVPKVMATNPVRSVTDLIAAAQVPGVQVTPTSGAPGAPARIRIRGIGSISQSNDPVVIVDGVWVRGPSSESNDLYRRGGGSNSNRFVPSPLNDIDPSTIKTIEIVRGPSAATLYGQDAANGVIIITTKRGQPGSTRWDLSYSRDWGTLPGANPPKYIGFGTRVFSSQPLANCNIYNLAVGVCTQDSVVAIQSNDPFLRPEGRSATDRYTLALDGGTDQLLYALNASFQNQIGNRRIAAVDRVRARILGISLPSRFNAPSDLRQTSLSARITARPYTTLDIALNFTASQSNQREDAINNLTDAFNLVDVRDTITIGSKTGQFRPITSGSISSTGLIGGSVDWRPTTWGRAAFQTGVERTNRRDVALTQPYTCTNGTCVSADGDRSGEQLETSVYTARFQLSASPTLGWANRFLSLRPSFGADFRKNAQALATASGSELSPGTTDISTAGYVSANLSNTAIATAGWYLNTTVGLFDRLYFDLGVRRDAGSALTTDATYPKLGTSWLVSDEPWFPDNPYVSNLRLRVAFGHAAVQPDVTDVYGKYQTSKAYINSVVVPSVRFAGIGNTDIKPERATELETGFDADLLYDRVQMTFTMVHKANVNNLIDRTLAPSAGVSATRKENVAKVVNRDIEMSVTGRLIDMPGTLLSVTTNMTFQDNRIARLGTGVSPFGSNDARMVEGYPVGGLWVRPVLGFSDTNGNGILEDTEIVLGDTAVYVGWMQPKVRVGYHASLSMFHRRVTLAAQLDYNGSYVQNLRQYDELGLWDPNAPLSEQALARVAQNVGIKAAISDLRFSSASLSWDLPRSVLSRLHARRVQIALQGSNLGLWTRYRGRDPGVNSTPAGEQLTDDGIIQPPPRQYTLAFHIGY